MYKRQEYEDGADVPRPLVYPKDADDTSFLTNRLMDFIAESTKPFIAHLSILRPHPPFVAPEPFNAMYDPQAVPGFKRKETHEEEANSIRGCSTSSAASSIARRRSRRSSGA